MTVPMEPLVHAYWTAKEGSAAEEYEDAFAYSPNSRHFAIADGATESSFADRWARSLVQKYSKEPPRPTGGIVPLPEWVKPLQEEWHGNIKWDALPWFAEEKARLGAFATFLGLSFTGSGPKLNGGFLTRLKRKKDRDKLLWRACAIGDSCLFHIRDETLLSSFPLTRSEQFQNTPLLLSSNPDHNRTVWDRVQVTEGDCRFGDLFLALTDALAKWFLADVERGGKPWVKLTAIHSESAFETFVQELRGTKALRNDDTTMLSIHWGNHPNAGKTTFSIRW
jgi:hypothetical protein